MLCRHRILSVLCVLSLVAFVSYPAQAGPIVMKGSVRAAGDVEAEAATSVTLPPNRKAARSLEAAEDLIQDRNWDAACAVLQALLDLPEDAFIPVRGQAKDADGPARWASVRAEANRILGTLPAKGREVYELEFGARAREQLRQAKQAGDVRKLAQTSQRYRHTKAGKEALALLGTHHLGRGRTALAALCYERLIDDAGPVTPLTLVKAALAFRRSGDEARAAHALKRLETLAPRGVTLGERQLSVTELTRELEQGQVAADDSGDWLAFRGDFTRAHASPGSAPFLDDDVDRWSVPTATEPQTKQWLSQALEEAETRGPALPAFFPLIAGNKLVLRSHSGIRALDLRSGKPAWEAASELGLDKLVGPAERRGPVMQWVQAYFQGGNHNILFENSTLGTLSTDRARVYAVDDLAVVPHPVYLQQTPWRGGNSGTNLLGSFEDDYRQNILKAYDLTTGALQWQRGGKAKEGDPPSFYLGPPLPLGGKLYALAETKGSLRLLCLDAVTGAESWTQALAEVRDPLPNDTGRRIKAAHLAYGKGVLVCPTNAGAVLGVDLLTHSLLWAYSYRERSSALTFRVNQWNPKRAAQVGHSAAAPDWKHCAPVIHGEHVFVTAPDGGSIHCLNLRDGSLAWKAARADDLYLAGVIHDKVLLVGSNKCRALDSATGKQVWCVETGTPSGLGAASGSLYYLPLKSCAGTANLCPEVCTIDVARGKVVAHARSRKREVPGNLTFADGLVISQTATAITAYPQLTTRLAKVERALSAEPNDPTQRAARADLRLDRGDLHGAVDDLRVALEAKPTETIRARLREKLHETLTELLGSDFAAGEKHLKEYRELCKVAPPDNCGPRQRDQAEAETRRRQATCLCLIARGRERQGKAAEAFRAYCEFAEVTRGQALLAVPDDAARMVRPDAWARGRLAALIAAAAPDERQRLEADIARQIKEASNGSDRDALRRLVALFGPVLPSGQEARLELAHRLIGDTGAGLGRFAEAELHLLRTRSQLDATVAARATLQLARLMDQKNLHDDAAHWYRTLREEFPKAQVEDGRTATELVDALPDVKETPAAWPEGDLSATETPNVVQARAPLLVFDPDTEPLPFFRRHEMVLNANSFQFQLVYSTKNREVWSQRIPRGSVRVQFFGNRSMRLPCKLLGHLAVVNIGSTMYAFDLLGQRVVWEKELLTQSVLGNPYQIVPAAEGGFEAYYPDGRVQKISPAGPVTATYVCLHTRNGLTALDPLDGSVLWTRADVSSQAQAFGDEEHLYVVDVAPDGTKVSRAFRASDGAAVAVPDFAASFERKLRTRGRCILLADEAAGTDLTLRLQDAHTGKVCWKQSFAAGSRLVRGESSGPLAILDPNTGRLVVLDPTTGRQELQAAVNPADLTRLQQAHLIRDDQQVYLALQQAPQGAAVGGGPWPNVTSMNCVPINGMLYAFDHTGKQRWKTEIAQQRIVLERFHDVPMILCTTRSLKNMQPGRGQSPVTKTICLDKRTGRVVYEKEQHQGTPFHSLKVDAATHRIQLSSYTSQVELRAGKE